MSTPPDDRLSLAKGYQRAAQVVTIAVGMVVPGLLGYWLDSRVQTRPLLTVLGFALGMTYGMYQLVRLAHVEQEQAEREDGAGPKRSDGGRE